MIKIKIDNTHYLCPSSWADITLRTYIKYLKDVQPTAPAKINDLFAGGQVKLSRKELNDCYSFMARSVECFCGVPYSLLINKVVVGDLQKLWINIEKSLKNDLANIQREASGDSFIFKGEQYFYPEKLMTNSTAGELIMAQLLTDGVSNLERGDYLSLPKITAVLCRRTGEWYEDFDIEARAELFMDLSMDILLGMGFFLLRLQKNFAEDSQIYTAMQTLMSLQRVSETYKSGSGGI